MSTFPSFHFIQSSQSIFHQSSFWQFIIWSIQFPYCFDVIMNHMSWCLWPLILWQTVEFGKNGINSSLSMWKVERLFKLKNKKYTHISKPVKRKEWRLFSDHRWIEFEITSFISIHFDHKWSETVNQKLTTFRGRDIFRIASGLIQYNLLHIISRRIQFPYQYF